MAKIHVLDPHTAELIAAGEVVERPASVVKELMENALDAGAKHITVAIERGGVSLIQVSDDGTGIEAESLPTAFVRHATSKIAVEEDLEHILTLGFRGEALASIASVSRVEVVTKTQEDEFASCYRVEGGVEQGLEPSARPVGTTFTVRDLFYNTPARMKFLKKDQTEAGYVADVAAQLALSRPEVCVKFLKEGKAQFQTPGDGTVRGAAYAVLSRDFARELVEVDMSSAGMTVSGLITPPAACRASRSMQFFFINGRYVKNRTMMAALEAAYQGTLMQKRFPGCVLNLTMPPQMVDVNVHPAKTEVRFAREKDVFEAVYAAVKSALAQPQTGFREFAFQDKPQKESEPAKEPFAEERTPAAPVLGQTRAPEKAAAARPAQTGTASGEQLKACHQWMNDFSKKIEQSALREAPAAPSVQSVSSVRAAYEVKPDIFVQEDEPCHRVPVPQEQKAVEPVPCTNQAVQPMPAQTSEACEQITLLKEEAPPLRLIGEIFHTYLITQRGDAMCLIDKHAAHERILYEDLMAGFGVRSSQMLLCPVTVQVSAQEKHTLLDAQELLQKSGLEVEDFGTGAVVVRAVPADIEEHDIQNLVLEVASRLMANPNDTMSEKTEWVLHSIACRAAIKAGDKTPPETLLGLARRVLDGEIPPFCPHGRPVVLKITQKELEKQFGRQG